jgi:hypothetical protein
LRKLQFLYTGWGAVATDLRPSCPEKKVLVSLNTPDEETRKIKFLEYS